MLYCCAAAFVLHIVGLEIFFYYVWPRPRETALTEDPVSTVHTEKIDQSPV